mmetsp:Transcript_29845/g.74883  ORF Transcript_29845/g.74883 Transcript_29845/m.74883 type:complete len:220 (+) Transcript_29845:287-946(+)
MPAALLFQLGFQFIGARHRILDLLLHPKLDLVKPRALLLLEPILQHVSLLGKLRRLLLRLGQLHHQHEVVGGQLRDRLLVPGGRQLALLQGLLRRRGASLCFLGSSHRGRLVLHGILAFLLSCCLAFLQLLQSASDVGHLFIPLVQGASQSVKLSSKAVHSLLHRIALPPCGGSGLLRLLELQRRLMHAPGDLMQLCVHLLTALLRSRLLHLGRHVMLL